jgi:PIN domain nuclease of toxin-antitoxin system
MKLLLDTHAFIWWDSEPVRLSAEVLALCQDPKNTLLLSVGSTWEMQIKIQLGKLKLSLSLAELVESQQRVNNLEILPITLEHILGLEELPLHHKDPFDRLLIAQAKIEGATLITRDPIFANYAVKVVW